MSALLAFAAGLVSLRLAAELARRAYRAVPPSRELVAWSAALGAYAIAAAALAAGSAGGWHDATFRIYYLFGALLTAPLLGIGSLLRAGRQWASVAGLLYSGLAVGVAIAMPISPAVAGDAIPHAQDHLELFPARVVAIAGNSLGTLAVVAVALATIRRRPLGNGLVLAALAVAALGSGISTLSESVTAALLAVAAFLLYAGAAIAPAPASAHPRGDERSQDGERDGALGRQPPRASVREHQPLERIQSPPTV
jgi:hypothetical protein